MMNTQLFMVLAVIVMATGVQSYMSDEEIRHFDELAELCRKPQNKEICAVIAEQLNDNMEEVQKLEMKEKRKPSFVRFGKRSDIEMEKRKPSFVRFGRK